MAKRLIKIPLMKLIETIVCVILNEFDCFIIVEGGTGIGKSSLAFHVARKVKRIMRQLKSYDEETVMHFYNKIYKDKGIPLINFIAKIEKLRIQDGYNFKANRDLVYTQGEMMKGLTSYYRIVIPDEMINITFNRDFYSEDQKNIIKMINMYRDHNNLVIACVPQFQTLDNQIKNLCKIRLSVIRRGYALIQTPNKTIYGRDKWDQQVNEKIEREWIIKGIQKPSYARLTTVRGITRFPKLSPKLEKLYQSIKDKKRTIILKKQMGLSGEEEKESTVQRTLKLLIDGKIRNANVVDGIAFAEGKSEQSFKDSLSKELKKLGMDHRVAQYYWDKKVKKGAEAGIF